MDTTRVKDVGIMTYKKPWNPYEGLETNAPYTIPSRHYVKPTIIRMQDRHYNAEADLNQTARVVVGGAVVIGTLGLLGGLVNK